MKEADSQELEAVARHAANLEAELARYAARFGLTEEARRLFRTSPFGEVKGSAKSKDVTTAR